MNSYKITFFLDVENIGTTIDESIFDIEEARVIAVAQYKNKNKLRKIKLKYNQIKCISVNVDGSQIADMYIYKLCSNFKHENKDNINVVISNDRGFVYYKDVTGGIDYIITPSEVEEFVKNNYFTIRNLNEISYEIIEVSLYHKYLNSLEMELDLNGKSIELTNREIKMFHKIIDMDFEIYNQEYSCSEVEVFLKLISSIDMRKLNKNKRLLGYIKPLNSRMKKLKALDLN